MDGSAPTKKVWGLTQEAFEKLLARLDADRERAGEKYETIRRTLVKFFEWHGGVSPEEHADETINRVTRRIDEGEEIRNLSCYFHGVAGMLWREIMRERAKERAAADFLQPPVQIGEQSSASEARLECLERCIGNLPAQSRELIVEYYQAKTRAKIERRKALAEQLGMPLNALRIRAHRIRAKLEGCVHDCLKQSERGMTLI